MVINPFAISLVSRAVVLLCPYGFIEQLNRCSLILDVGRYRVLHYWTGFALGQHVVIP
jgi:hypothetical protein